MLKTRNSGNEPEQVRTPSTQAEANALVADVNRGVADLRSAVDAVRTRSEEVSGELQARIAEQGTALAAMEEAIARFNRSRIAQTEAAQEQDTEARSAFGGMIRRGNMDALYERGAVRNEKSGARMERAAVGQTGESGLGGYLVEPTIDREITRFQKVFSNIRAYATIKTVTGDRYQKPYARNGAAGGWESELNSDRDQTDANNYGMLEIFNHELWAEVVHTQRMLEDAGLDVEGETFEAVGETFAVLEAAAFVNGNNAGKPQGFTQGDFEVQTPGTESSFGKVGVFKTGTNAAYGATGAEADIFRKVPLYIKPQFLVDAAWYMSRLELAKVICLKDENGVYLWQPGLSAANPSTLVGFATRTIDEMEAGGVADRRPVAFGSMRQFYTITDRLGLRFLRNPYLLRSKTLFQFWKRVGGGIHKAEAMKFIQQSA